MSNVGLKDKARALADLDAGSIVATVDIAAAPERVFRALMSGEVANWWGSEGSYRVTQWKADLRAGGTWVSSGKGSDGRQFEVRGTILEYDPPRKVVKTWNYDWDGGGNETTLTYELEPVAGGTRLKVHHTGFGERRSACEDHAKGWEHVLGWLADYVHSGGKP